MLVKKNVDVYPVINIIHDHHPRNRNNRVSEQQRQESLETRLTKTNYH